MGGREPSRQLTFDLARDPAFEAEDFLVAPSNARAFESLDLWPDWTAPTLLLVGPPGSGKSHLAAIWARRAGAVTIRRTDTFDPSLLADRPAVLIDDCDRASRPEAALFHLINLMKEAGGWLLMTARTSPDLWGLATPDLLSRLRLSPVATIDHPDPGLIRAVLVKLFADRQLKVDGDIIAFASLHLDQSLDAATRFVEAIDQASLETGRRITKPLVSVTLATLQASDHLR